MNDIVVYLDGGFIQSFKVPTIPRIGEEIKHKGRSMKVVNVIYVFQGLGPFGPVEVHCALLK